MKAPASPKPPSARVRRIPEEVFEKYRRACEPKSAGQDWNAVDLIRKLRKGR